MVLGVLSDPRVAVVDIRRHDVLVDGFGHDHDPLGQELRAESVVRASVGEVDDQFEGLVGERLQRQQHVVDQQVPVDVTGLVSEWRGEGRELFNSVHYGTKPGHFETSKIHFPTSEGVSEVSERVSGASERTSE